MSAHKKKTDPQHADSPPQTWGLPDAGIAVEEPAPTSTFLPNELPIGYTGRGEERETNNLSPKKSLKNEDKDQKLSREFPRRAVSAEDQSSQVPLWVNRTTGREVSPVDFIKMHYGRVNPDGSWESLGLSRSDLRQQDRKLYQAYSSWISKGRHPEDDLGLDKIEHTEFATVEEALQHKQRVVRDASARYRERQRTIL